MVVTLQHQINNTIFDTCWVREQFELEDWGTHKILEITQNPKHDLSMMSIKLGTIEGIYSNKIKIKPYAYSYEIDIRTTLSILHMFLLVRRMEVS